MRNRRFEVRGSFNRICLIAVVSLAAAGPAMASGSYQSFSATNYIAGSTTLSGFPTNSAGTNGLNQLTGGPISVANNEHANFVFKSQPVGADATNSMTFKLLRSYANGTPSIAANQLADWETLPTLTLVFNQNGTNATTWSTNLDFWLGGAGQVGIFSMQNGQSAALTNFEVGLYKKIVPTVFP